MGAHSQEGQSLSTSKGASGTTAWEPASSLDNTATVTREQGLRPRRQAPWLPPQPGPSTLNLGLPGVFPKGGENKLDDPSHK